MHLLYSAIQYTGYREMRISTSAQGGRQGPWYASPVRVTLIFLVVSSPSSSSSTTPTIPLTAPFPFPFPLLLALPAAAPTHASTSPQRCCEGMSGSRHPAHVPTRDAHPRACARAAISTVSNTSRSSRCFVMTSMSPSARYASIIPVKIARNSVYVVPPPPPLAAVVVVVVSTSRVNSRGKEMPRLRPRVALAETSDEKDVCTRERSVVSARSTGDTSCSASASTFGFEREEENVSGAQQAETACTVLI